VLSSQIEQRYFSPNYIINGAFDIWQRGTSFANPSNTTSFTADRFFHYRGGLVTGMTTSRQDAGLAGFRYCARIQRASGNTSTESLNVLYNTTETSQAVALAGKTVTFSFYARAGANYSGTLTSGLVSGTGVDQNPFSWTGASTVVSGSQSLSGTWQRFSLTGVMPSNSSEFYLSFTYTPTGTAGANDFFEVTGVQLEEGTTASPFRRNANSIQGELAACQRYYYRIRAVAPYTPYAMGYAFASNQAETFATLPVTMRVAPASIDFSAASDFMISDGTTSYSISALGIFPQDVGQNTVGLSVTRSAGGLTTNRFHTLLSFNNQNSFIGFNAEL
jgi:hypothetical protein